MSFTKVLGKCCNTACSKKSTGKCQNFFKVEGSHMCGYCECHEAAHELKDHLATPSAVAAPLPTASITPIRAVVSGPTLQDRRATADERKRIFDTQQKVGTPSPRKKSKAVPAPAPAPAPPARPARVILPDTLANRRQDRADALLNAPEGVTRTDLDMGEFFRVNGVPWLPEVLDVAPVQDFTKYCFACKTQHEHADRDTCKGNNCNRYMFIECGQYGAIEGLDLVVEYVDPMFFRCCDCKKRNESAEEFQLHVESLPPRSSNSRFSGNTF